MSSHAGHSHTVGTAYWLGEWLGEFKFALLHPRKVEDVAVV